MSIETDLNVTGKVAQFGRGVMADVSSKLLGQFVTCLETNVLGGALAGDPAPAAPAADPAAPPAASPPAPVPLSPSVSAPEPATGTAPAVARTIDAPEAEAVDLVRMAGAAVARRVVPALIAAAAIVGMVVWLIAR